MKETIHIVGGGLSGCAFSYFLKKDFNIVLYEKSPDLGGLLQTRKSIENIPWSQVPGILHTNRKWIIDLFSQILDLKDVNYKIAMNPLFDLRYYNYPFNKSTIDTMPWHWKEAILQDLETSNGEYSNDMEELITNFYGDTVYDIFYKNYFKRMFGTNKILTEWYRSFMRDVHTDFEHYTEKYIKFPVNKGWNDLFSFFTKDIDIIYNSNVTEKDFHEKDFIIVTTELDKFLNLEKSIYSYGSFEIDSTPYKNNSPDTIIYPNYTPYLTMTQCGKYYQYDFNGNLFDKNIIVKMFVDDGDIPLYPIPTKKNRDIYIKEKSKYKNIKFVGRAGSWSFMDIDNIMDQAQKMSAKIKHSRRTK